MSGLGRKPVLSAIICGEAQDALIIGNQRTGEFDRGRDQEPIRRVAMFELIETIAAGSGTMAERRRLNAGPLEEARNPCLDRKIQLDPPAVDEQSNFLDTDGTQTDGSPVLPAIVDQCTRRRTQEVVAAIEPERDMRVEQKCIRHRSIS